MSTTSLQLSLAILFLVVWAFAVAENDNADYRRHHAYAGVALIVIGLAIGAWRDVVGTWIVWLGVAFIADDAVEHLTEHWTRPRHGYSIVLWLYGVTGASRALHRIAPLLFDA